MKRKFLTDLGLESEQVEKIMKEHGATVNSLKDDLDKVDEYKQQIEDYKKEVADRDKQLEELGKKAEGNEELQKQIKDLQAENENTKKENEENLSKARKDSKLDLALLNAKAKNPKAVKALLDAESIKLDGDKLLGLDEQLKALQESDSYLFGEGDRLGGRDPHPTDPNKPATQKNPFSKDDFNMTEQGQLIRNEPDKARDLIKQAGKNPALYGL
ncbi:phage scaffolding protein [Virgibacillus sp. C22-A2]|uniref:Phage scaffolding protein n=1 Tax=Virgibacillus tibetensis TaxID=3042313 RepID=A0ABU6KCC8_9BACI|nr:phage scaffolding protein [Virgibacillus sp. C22-A2]